MKLPLREHQQRLADRLWEMRYGFDTSEMGTGKSVTALYLIERSGLKAVIVVPSYLALNWRVEIEKFTSLTWEVYTPKKDSYKADILLVSYAMIHKASAHFKGRKFILADEAHYLSNPQSQRSKAFKEIVKTRKPDRLLLMSGTILRNNVAELWHPFCLVDAGHNRGFRSNFKSWYKYKDTYQYRIEKRIYGRRIVTWEGAKSHESLKAWRQAFTIGVRRSEVAELPPLQRIPLVAAPPSPQLDKELLDAYEEYAKGVIGGANIHTVKRKSAAAKAPYAIAFAEGLLESGAGPLVIFSDHVEAAALIAEGLGIKHRLGLVTGGVAMDRRAAIVAAFQDGSLDVIVATIGSMSLGVTLTRGNIVIFNDKNFDPSQNTQARARVLRIGQGAEKVLCYEILREGVDARINELLESKLAVTESVMEEYEGADLDW